MLSALKNAGLRTAILSSASPMMLEAAVESAGIGEVLDAVISVDGLRMHNRFHTARSADLAGRPSVRSMVFLRLWSGAATRADRAGTTARRDGETTGMGRT